jgi:hypothetical protein
MIAQTPVVGPMNGVVRSPVQHQPHPIHVWQQETTAKFIQPINQANRFVTQQNFPIQPHQTTIPNQVTQIIPPPNVNKKMPQQATSHKIPQTTKQTSQF